MLLLHMNIMAARPVEAAGSLRSGNADTLVLTLDEGFPKYPVARSAMPPSERGANYFQALTSFSLKPLVPSSAYERVNTAGFSANLRPALRALCTRESILVAVCVAERRRIFRG